MRIFSHANHRQTASPPGTRSDGVDKAKIFLALRAAPGLLASRRRRVPGAGYRSIPMPPGPASRPGKGVMVLEPGSVRQYAQLL